MLSLHQPQSQDYGQIKDLLGGPYIPPTTSRDCLRLALAYLPHQVLLQWEQDGGSANTGHWALSLASRGGQTRGSIELHSGRGGQSPCLG